MQLEAQHEVSDYGYDDADHTHSHSYIASHVLEMLKEIEPSRVIDLGCGNGSLTARIAEMHDAVGVDASLSGIAIARAKYPKAKFFVKSVYDDLQSDLGTFDAAVSTEVIEHLYSPRTFLRTAGNLLSENGYLILTTPYHGYLKNLALAISGRLDAHFTALWDGGHIKFWSVKTLCHLLDETGFEVKQTRRVGRVPVLAKSMIILAAKRQAQ